MKILLDHALFIFKHDVITALCKMCIVHLHKDLLIVCYNTVEIGNPQFNTLQGNIRHGITEHGNRFVKNRQLRDDLYYVRFPPQLRI